MTRAARPACGLAGSSRAAGPDLGGARAGGALAQIRSDTVECCLIEGQAQGPGRHGCRHDICGHGARDHDQIPGGRTR